MRGFGLAFLFLCACSPQGQRLPSGSGSGLREFIFVYEHGVGGFWSLIPTWVCQHVCKQERMLWMGLGLAFFNPLFSLTGVFESLLPRRYLIHELTTVHLKIHNKATTITRVATHPIDCWNVRGAVLISLIISIISIVSISGISACAHGAGPKTSTVSHIPNTIHPIPVTVNTLQAFLRHLVPKTAHRCIRVRVLVLIRNLSTPFLLHNDMSMYLLTG